jgi:hypothetical protein
VNCSVSEFQLVGGCSFSTCEYLFYSSSYYCSWYLPRLLFVGGQNIVLCKERHVDSSSRRPKSPTRCTKGFTLPEVNSGTGKARGSINDESFIVLLLYDAVSVSEFMWLETSGEWRCSSMHF